MWVGGRARLRESVDLAAVPIGHRRTPIVRQRPRIVFECVLLQRHGYVAARAARARIELVCGFSNRAAGGRRVSAGISGEEIVEAAVLLDDDDHVFDVTRRTHGWKYVLPSARRPGIRRACG